MPLNRRAVAAPLLQQSTYLFAIAFFLKLDSIALHSSPASMSIELADSTASVAVKQEDANASEKHSPGQPPRFHFASICNKLSLAVCF